MSKLDQAFVLFDDYNKQSPEDVEWEGHVYPAEYFYAIRLHECVKRLKPDASEALLLASRCQHIGRWEIPRSAYPEGRVGYLKWRGYLAKYHASRASEILSGIGYDQMVIDRVMDIILKKNFKTDVEVQTMEDALCLVFLEFQYDDLISKHPDEKMIAILQKTWMKMSEQGRGLALAIDYSERGKVLINNALNS